MGRYSPKGHYDKDFKRQVIEEIQQGRPRQAVYLEYGVKPSTLNEWLADNRTACLPASRQRPVPPQFKRSVTRAVLTGRMTIEEAQSAFGIKDCRTIKRWIQQSNQENDEIAVPMKKNKNDSKATKNDNEQLKALQQQLEDAQLKIAALNTLIDVAEEQLNINIRKKPGAKQSND